MENIGEFGLCLFGGSPRVTREQEIWTWLLLWISSKRLVVDSPSLLCSALALWQLLPKPRWWQQYLIPTAARTRTVRNSQRRPAGTAHLARVQTQGRGALEELQPHHLFEEQGWQFLSVRPRGKTPCGWLCAPPLSSPHLLPLLFHSPHPPSKKMLWVLALLAASALRRRVNDDWQLLKALFQHLAVTTPHTSAA